MTDRVRAIFSRLPPGKITSDMFRTSGYHDVSMPDNDLRRWLTAINWCNEHMPHRFHSMGMTFWFVHEDDATEFALVWR